MGFKAIELAPISGNGVSATTPVGKDILVKAFKVARTDTTAAVKAVLPGDATIIDIHILGVASDAATTATVSIGSTSTSTEYVSGQDVKTAGGMIRPTSAMSSTNVGAVENLPISTDLPIYAKYAETGTASTVGGPYLVLVYYVR